MTADRFDLLVLGAGPAGSATAIAAARAGLRVGIVDRAAFPRHRPGETLPPGIEPLLRHLGAEGALLGAGYPRHAGIWVRWQSPLRFQPFGADGAGAWLGFQAERGDFDRRLLAAAGAAGADVRCDANTSVAIDGTRVIGLRCGNEELNARFVVDATGSGRVVARALGLGRRCYSRRLTARYGYVRGECLARDAAPLIASDTRGWTWTARIGSGLYQWTRLDLGRSHSPRSWRPSEFRELRAVGTSRGADVTWQMAERVAGAGFFLAGDAAAVLDPSSSHGVLRAVMSGMMAAHLAARHIRGGSDEADCTMAYQSWLSASFHRDRSALAGMYERAGLAIE